MKFIASDKRFIIFPIVFLFIYIFAAAIPLGSDLYFMPIWVRDILPDAARTALDGVSGQSPAHIQAESIRFTGKIPKVFITDTHFGYFTAEGELLYSAPIMHRISASSAAWTEYSADTVKTSVYRPDGSLLLVIEEPGFVHIDEDRFYLFEPGGSAVKQYSSDGTVVWRYLHTAPITAFQSGKQGVVIGFSDGKLVALNAAGAVLFDFYPGGSNYQVILGAALSQDGRMAVCVCGLEQQRVLLIRVDGNKHKIIHHRYLTGDLRRQVFAGFDNGGKYAVFECAEGIGIIDCEKQLSGIIPEQGTVIASGLYPYKNIMAVITKKDQTSILSFIEAPLHIIGKTSFASENTFLVQENETLFLVTDTKLARIDTKGILK